jgi:hypothetical protein
MVLPGASYQPTEGNHAAVARAMPGASFPLKIEDFLLWTARIWALSAKAKIAWRGCVSGVFPGKTMGETLVPSISRCLNCDFSRENRSLMRAGLAKWLKTSNIVRVTDAPNFK